MSRVLVVQYAKWPELGKVKTRIGKLLGDQRALEIHMELLAAVMENLLAQRGYQYQLWLNTVHPLSTGAEEYDVSPQGREAAMSLEALISENSIDCLEQHGGNLGEKMWHTFETSSKSFEKTLIVGSDCPMVSVEVLAEVAEKLEAFDVVIVPAEDGGYVLIAMRKKAIKRLGSSSNWLTQIDWGTSEVLQQTLARCDDNGLSYKLLAASWDVDEVEDYQRWLHNKS